MIKEIVTDKPACQNCFQNKLGANGNTSVLVVKDSPQMGHQEPHFNTIYSMVFHSTEGPLTDDPTNG
jgi:hypothetical protein